MVAPVIAVPVLVAVMLDSRPNSSAGSQRPHTDGGGSTGRYGTVPVTPGGAAAIGVGEREVSRR